MKIRALVLAAGLGRRLRPLTEDLPKPLLPVTGKPILSWTLERLRAAGCEAVAVNLFHAGERIRERYGDEHEGLPLVYSEERELLGTLGAVHPLRDFFAGCDLVLVVNGDSLCRWPFKKLLRSHRRSGAAATLMLTRRPDPREFGGGVGIDRQGRILSFSDADRRRGEVYSRHVFAGVHLLSAELLERVGEGPSDFVQDLYVPLLDEGARLQAVASEARWHDLGTPRRYLEGVLDWARGRGPTRWFRRSWCSPLAEVDGGQIQSSVLEGDARVERGAKVVRCLLLPGARVEPEAVVKDSILGPGAVVPRGAWVERRLIMPQQGDTKPNPGDSLVGGMVYSSLGPAPKPPSRI